MKHVKTALGLFCGLMTLFWALVWLDNIYLSWGKRIWMMEPEAASQVKGLFPALDSLSIDHSTVATFIPFFGFAWLSWQLYKIHRHSKRNIPMELNKEFPFFNGYNEWMVSLGLMGTVWGLIMIGYLPNLENLLLTGLIGSLRTALFSTLVALFWVYIIVLRIIRPGMRLFAAKHLKQPDSNVSVSSLQSSIETFAMNIEKLNRSISTSITTIEDLKKKINVKQWEKAEKLICTSIETVEAIKIAGNERTAILNELSNLQSAQSEKLSSIEASLKQRDARAEKDRKRLGDIIDAVKRYSED